MTLDSKLNWEEHIDTVRPKAKRVLNAIKVVPGKKWEKDWKSIRIYTPLEPRRKKLRLRFLYQLRDNTSYTESLNILDEREDQNYEESKGATKTT